MKILMLIGAMLGAVPACAQTVPNPLDPNKIYRGLDQLSQMAVDQVFRIADLNRDGYLSRAELAKAASSRGGIFMPDLAVWNGFDHNRDGYISRSEALYGLKSVQESTRNGTPPLGIRRN